MSAKRQWSLQGKSNSYLLGGNQGQLPNYYEGKWCRWTESNDHPGIFKPVREPSLLHRQGNW